MTRYVYGASGAAQVVSPTGVPTVAPATVKDARTGGSTVSDIQNIAGGALAGIVTPDVYGQTLFQGPDGFAGPLWLDFGSGPRWAVHPVDLDSVVAIKRAALAAAEKASPSGTTAKNALPYTSATIGADQMAAIDPLLLPKYASAAARNAVYTSPADGDRVRRTDARLVESYHGGLSRWVPDGMTLINEAVLANSTTTIVTFSSIPSNFKHLKVVYTGRAASGGGTASAVFQPVRIRFNGDSAADYYYFNFFRRVKHTFGGSTVAYDADEAGANGVASNATAITSGILYAPASVSGIPAVQVALTVGYIPGYGTGSSAWGGGEFTVPNYTQAGHRGVHGSHGWSASDGSAAIYHTVGQTGGSWINSGNITSMSLYVRDSNFWLTGSTISLYGMS